MSFRDRFFHADEQAKRDLDEEIAAHLALAIADKRARGMSEEEARTEARREFGNVALVQDTTRKMWDGMWLETLGQNVRYALRGFRRAPGFTFAVVGTLALGIGAAAAMFSVVDKVMLSPVPYPQAERLVDLQEESKKGGTPAEATFLDVQAWQQKNHSLEEIAYYRAGGRGVFLEANGKIAEITPIRTSANLFRVLGVAPFLGHGFDEQESALVNGANARGVVLSAEAWRAFCGNDPQIVGKTVRLNDETFTVLGVMPEGAAFRSARMTTQPAVWTTLRLEDADKSRAGWVNGYSVLGRLKPGVQVTTAEAELSTIQAALAPGYVLPEIRENRERVVARRYADVLVGSEAKKALAALLGASAVLWLIACVNVTNLFLIRGSGRQREVAVRTALGASRGRVLGQFLMEGLLLSGIAALLGGLLAWLVLVAFEAQISLRFATHARANMSWRLLGVLALLTLLSTFFAAVWPAILAANGPLESALKAGAQQSGTARRHQRVRSVLVVAEIAMSLTLLMGCGLLLRTIYVLRNVPLGFRTDHIVVASLSVPSYRYAKRDLRAEFYNPLLEKTGALPGVQAAGLISQVPLGHTYKINFSMRMEGRAGHEIHAELKAMTPSVQQVFGFKMWKGRFFNSGDTEGSQPVMVINRAFAKEYAPDGNLASLIGKNLLNMKEGKPIEIIGILDDQRQTTVAQESQPEIDLCLPQIAPTTGFYRPGATNAMDLVVRTDRPLAGFVPELRGLMHKAVPQMADPAIETMDQMVEDSYRNQTLAVRVLEVFGGVALLLCIAGIYGLVAYMVTQRTHEIGVRIAVGAQRMDILWLILRQAGILTLAGVAVGMLASALGGRLVQTFLYGISAHDGWVLLCVGVTVTAFSAVAAYLPARRAMAVDPVRALQAE
jgi:predicted permease